MNGKQHIIFGITTSTALAMGLKDTNTFLEMGTLATVLCGTIGSVLPDIDHQDSGIGYRFPTISKFINNKFGHRGVTHDVGIMGTLLVLFLLTKHPVAVHIMLGVLGHIFLDAFTTVGIPRPFLSIRDRKYFININNPNIKKEFYDKKIGLRIWNSYKTRHFRDFHTATTIVTTLAISSIILTTLSFIPGSHGLEDVCNIVAAAVSIIRTK